MILKKLKLPVDYFHDDYKSLLLKSSTYPYSREWSSAVFLLIVQEHIFFIKRSEEMPTYKGQIGFPGGKREASDQTPLETAYRELEEETAVTENEVDLLGLLPYVYASHHRTIIPIVGHYKHSLLDFKQKLRSNSEWDIGFLVKSSTLFQANAWSHSRRVGKQTIGSILFRPILDFEYNQIKGRSTTQAMFLWGASARILWSLKEVFNASLDSPSF